MNDRVRLRLIRDLEAKGIRDARVLEVMSRTPRELFVLADQQAAAYEDRALPIPAGQTISQPYMVALMTHELALSGDESVLEIGTGSGYQTAILAPLCRRVVTLERIAELSDSARRVLDGLHLFNIEYHQGDGTLGWPAGAPYDRIVVTAAAPAIPPRLYEQLKIGGKLVIPVGTGAVQMLQTIVRRPEGPLVIDVCECCFVKLIGEAGWQASENE